MLGIAARTAAAILMAAGSASPDGAEAPGASCVPYVLAPGHDRGTVCWQTAEAAAGSVRFRTAGGSNWREESGARGRFHAVRLTGLRPGTEHQIEVLADGRKIGGLQLRTPPAKLDSFTFFVYGDTRSNPDRHRQVADAILAEAARLDQFTFVLMTGDLADTGADERDTAEQFFDPAAVMLRRLPLVPVRGNHEEDSDLFARFFPDPPRETRDEADDFCLDYGSVRLLVVDQYKSARAKGPRMEWLTQRLAEAPGPWRLVGFHEPLYSSGDHGPNEEFRAVVEPRLVNGRVHAVLCGHEHLYERSRPVDGVTHLVSGGGGAPPGPSRPQGDGPRAAYRPVLHFLSVAVTPEKLVIKAHAVAGPGGASEVFDEVTIPARCDWPTEPRPVGSATYLLGTNPWRGRLLTFGIALLAAAAVAKAIKTVRMRKTKATPEKGV